MRKKRQYLHRRETSWWWCGEPWWASSRAPSPSAPYPSLPSQDQRKLNNVTKIRFLSWDSNEWEKSETYPSRGSWRSWRIEWSWCGGAAPETPRALASLASSQRTPSLFCNRSLNEIKMGEIVNPSSCRNTKRVSPVCKREEEEEAAPLFDYTRSLSLLLRSWGLGFHSRGFYRPVSLIPLAGLKRVGFGLTLLYPPLIEPILIVGLNIEVCKENIVFLKNYPPKFLLFTLYQNVFPLP